jgi:Ca2+-binding RTX toxin-like protein
MAKARLNLDSLDHRIVPSATLANGVLTINGTEGRDVIVVRQAHGQLRIRGESIEVNGSTIRSVGVADVKRIEVSAGAGNDRVNLIGVRVAISVDAGDGDDRVFGGVGDDTIVGGGGDDRLFGFGGSDDISGGVGDDRIFGGAGDDQLLGEEGDDRVNGQVGNDNCDGGTGDDRITGGRGRDSNRGGGGDDRVTDVDARMEVEGVISAIDLAASTVTIRTQSGALVDVTAGPNTVIERNEQHTTLAAFQVGDRAEAKFDAEGVAIKIEAVTTGAADDDSSDDRGGNSSGGNQGGDQLTRVEGTITGIDLGTSRVTIRTQSGRLVDVTAGPNTKIERNDVHVTLAAFRVGDRAEARFDAQRATVKIEAEGL